MSYPQASQEQIIFFQTHGYIVVKNAIDTTEIEYLDETCQEIIHRKDELAKDWAWEKGKSREEREFKIVQAKAESVISDITQKKFCKWMTEFGSSLFGKPVDYWYSQYIAKPPHDGAETLWHQDEGYWGGNLDDSSLTCWMPFHDVDQSNGCMQFIDKGHTEGMLEHSRPEHTQSDLLYCQPDVSRNVICPIEKGDVTFHHGKTPHMTTGNSSDGWRKVIATHMSVGGAPTGDRDRYPWHVNVNQT